MTENNTAIVLAAGQGKRMQSKIQKQFLEIQGYPVLYYSLRCFQESPLIGNIILVTGEETVSYCKEKIVDKYGFTKVTSVIAGGKERYDSVYAGLCACSEIPCDYVFIHDGARPFITEEMLERGLERTRKTGACVLGMPSKDTVKLADKNDKPLSADVDVDIRIVNDADEEVYTGTKSVSPDDFSYYTSQAAGEQYLANVRIPAAEIKAGKSASGKVYFTVYKENAVQFDEVNCDALYCLPIEDVQVTFDSFPLDLKVKDFMGSTASVIQIQGAEFKFDKDYSPQLTITITGEKKSGSSDSGYDMISYKLYDSAGYLVDSGNIYLSSLSAGEKFKDNSVVIYDITPGESYTFQLSEYSW